MKLRGASARLASAARSRRRAWRSRRAGGRAVPAGLRRDLDLARGRGGRVRRRRRGARASTRPGSRRPRARRSRCRRRSSATRWSSRAAAPTTRSTTRIAAVRGPARTRPSRTIRPAARHRQVSSRSRCSRSSAISAARSRTCASRAGLYAPNAYPFRDMCTELRAAAAVRVQRRLQRAAAADALRHRRAGGRGRPAVDRRRVPRSCPSSTSARGSRSGFAHLKSTLAVWGEPGNVDGVRQAGRAVHARRQGQLRAGVRARRRRYRPTPDLELGANYNSQVTSAPRARRRASSGPSVGAQRHRRS